MANNLTQLSTYISVFNIDRTESMLEQLKQEFSSRLEDDDWKMPDWVTVDDPSFIDEAFGNISIRRDSGKKPVLWVSADEHADLEAVGCVLGQLIQEEPDDDVMWKIPYADTSDSQRPGEYGGGILFVTKTNSAPWSTESLTTQIEKVLGNDSLLELLSFT